MSNEFGQRGLSQQAFLQDLSEGKLAPLLKRVKADTSLDLEIRQDYLNIYYRGGNLLRISGDNKSGGYSAFFEIKYGPALKEILPSAGIQSESDAGKWLALFPEMKNAMDLWFGANPKAERASQQMVVYENNAAPWAGGNDYFIIDIEYDNHIGARFDLVALRWDSNSTARKLHKEFIPGLAALELKAGDGALNGKAGLLDHYQQWEKFFSDASQLKSFKQEMLNVFKQKRELGLIPALADNRNAVDRVADDIEVIFLLANHDPASRKLKDAVEEIYEKQMTGTPKFKVCFAKATFMGYGLYSHNILSLEAFRTRLGQIEKEIA